MVEYANISEINNNINNRPIDFIKEQEDIFNKKVDKATEDIYSKNMKVVSVTGPSSSGKTTFSRILKSQLEKMGKECVVISLDDFYIDRAAIPKREDGKEDLESINAFDIPYLKDRFDTLKKYGKANFPIYNFLTKVRDEKTYPIELKDNTILIIEGIHSHNRNVLDAIGIEETYKVYMHTTVDFELDGNVILTTRQLRLIRRLIRDCLFRNFGIKATYDILDTVYEGEAIWITPYRDSSDIRIDSTHLFEPGLYKYYMDNIVATSELGPYGDRVADLQDRLNYFINVTDDNISKGCVVREFIG